MSLEKAREFFKSIEVGGKVQEEYRELLMESKDLSEKEIQEKVIRFASGKGFKISQEDIKSVTAELQNRELTDEELEAVAGGTTFKVSWIVLLGDDHVRTSPNSRDEYRYICFIVGCGMHPT